MQTKATIQSVPVGSLLIDCSAMTAFIEDLPPRARVGMQVTRRGFEEAVVEIVSNQEVLGHQVGVTSEDVQAILLANERVAMIDAYLPAARKLVEMLVETRSKLDDERHRRISEIAELVDARSKARRSSALLAAYEKTREYRSAPGLKAVRTRRRNAAQEGDGDVLFIDESNAPIVEESRSALEARSLEA